MKVCKWIVAFLSVAVIARAEPPNYSEIPDYKKVEPVVQYCWSTDHYEPCSSTASLPSGAATAANQTTTNTALGATNETAASTDTATSGINGRLQRIAQRLTSLISATTDGTQLVKGIPAPCASAPLTKLYQTTASRRSMTISLGATYTWAVVTNLDTAKQVGIRLNASDTDPYIIPSGASMPTIYPAAGVANLYADTNTTPASGGSTTYLSIYACP